jgi:hypothetical protein
MTRESEFGKQDRHPRRPFPENIRTRGPPIRSRGPAVPGRWRRPTRGWRGDPGPGCRWFVSNPQGDELVEGGLYGRAKHCTKHPHPEKRGLQSSNCETGGDDPEGVVREAHTSGAIIKALKRGRGGTAEALPFQDRILTRSFRACVRTGTQRLIGTHCGQRSFHDIQGRNVARSRAEQKPMHT